MNKIQQYDKIKLKDGRTGTVVEILGKNEVYIVDIDLENDWETETVYPEQIEI